MANSRRSPPADLPAHVALKLDALAGGARALMLALSGGRDSVVLLDVLVPLCAARGIRLCAAHVHHGLSPHADAWAAFCAALCDRHAVGFELAHVTVDRSVSTSIEAGARHARYRALATIARRRGVDAVLLAQHADDQAETVLLQLARGAGPHGLAAMPGRRDADGVVWVRPMLDIPRAVIDAHAKDHDLAFVDDDSNASPRFRRNALRHALVPALRAIAPGYPATLVRAARLAAETATLADDLAAIDAHDAFDGVTLARTRLCALPAHRARNLLRWFLRRAGHRPPSSARLEEMLSQIVDAAADARVELLHDGARVGLHAGRIVVHPLAPPDFDCAWRGETTLALPHGTLSFTPDAGGGLAATTDTGMHWSVRARRGGERLTLDTARPRRMLKSLLQEAGMPAWDRDALPLVFCGDALAAVPGVGIDVAFRARAGTAGLAVRWTAHARR